MHKKNSNNRVTETNTSQNDFTKTHNKIYNENKYHKKTIQKYTTQISNKHKQQKLTMKICFELIASQIFKLSSQFLCKFKILRFFIFCLKHLIEKNKNLYNTLYHRIIEITFGDLCVK